MTIKQRENNRKLKITVGGFFFFNEGDASSLFSEHIIWKHFFFIWNKNPDSKGKELFRSELLPCYSCSVAFYKKHLLSSLLGRIQGKRASYIINNYNSSWGVILCGKGLSFLIIPIFEVLVCTHQNHGSNWWPEATISKGNWRMLNGIDSCAEKLIPVLSPLSQRAEHRYSPCQFPMALHWSGSRARLDSAAFSLTSQPCLAPGSKVGVFFSRLLGVSCV